MKSDKQKIREVKKKLDGNTLECAHCIVERIVEGQFDRFGTTGQQEVEAMCDKHLIETEKFYREHEFMRADEWSIVLTEELKVRGI